MASIAENIALIKEQIALVSKGRKIEIAAVTKHQPVEKVKEAIEAGIAKLAVNYAQEGDELRLLIDNENIEWHFIGHIQSRKVKYLTEYHCIQSIDRMEVAQELNLRLEKKQRAVYVLIEVNIGREPQKSGVLPERLNDFLERLAALPNLKVIGLMAIPPMIHPVEDRRVYFKEMRQLFKQYRPLYSLEILSMGTSEDYLLAIQEGATMVRLGTCLFGHRSV